MNTITPRMTRITKTTQESAPGGGAVLRRLPRAGLNLAINAMVAPPFRAPCENQGVDFAPVTRRNWWKVTLAFAGTGSACHRSQPFPDLFPSTMGGVWRRTALSNLSPSDAPDPVSRTTIDQLQTASYEGPGKLEARVYELSSPAVALDLAQRWRPSADTVFFYRDQFFVVIKWQDADRKALQSFVGELEARLGKPKSKEKS